MNNVFDYADIVTFLGEFTDCKVEFKLSIYEIDKDKLSISAELIPKNPPLFDALKWRARFSGLRQLMKKCLDLVSSIQR